MDMTTNEKTIEPWEYAPEGEDTCTAMTDAPEGDSVCAYGDGVGYCTLTPGHTANNGLHLCTCTEHIFDGNGDTVDTES